MLDRCRNIKNQYYAIYGGRGIIVCERWMKYENFLEDMGEAPIGQSIDRINNDKGYYKENCKWSTIKEQMRNQSNTAYATYNGITKAIAEWAEIYNINRRLLYDRLVILNWPFDKAVTISVRKWGTNQ